MFIRAGALFMINTVFFLSNVKSLFQNNEFAAHSGTVFCDVAYCATVWFCEMFNDTSLA